MAKWIFLILILFVSAVLLKAPGRKSRQTKQIKALTVHNFEKQESKPVRPLKPAAAKNISGSDVQSYSGHSYDSTVHALYEVNEQNLTEMESICVPQQADNWEQACREIAKYFAKNRDWANAKQFADKLCESGDLQGCVMLAKIGWKENGSDEQAYMQIKRGCETEDGRAPAQVTVGEETFIRSDRRLCEELRKYSDPEQGWQAMLRLDVWSANHSLETYLREGF